jgi:hypothetical protein
LKRNHEEVVSSEKGVGRKKRRGWVEPIVPEEGVGCCAGMATRKEGRDEGALKYILPERKTVDFRKSTLPIAKSEREEGERSLACQKGDWTFMREGELSTWVKGEEG